MRYVFDIDGTLTLPDPTKDYEKAIPDKESISEVNRLYDAGHTITIFTARGASSGKDWHTLTVQQLKVWGVKYHTLLDTGKPSWDVFVDDKALNADEWKKSFRKKKIGFVAGTFDLLHPGHCLMLKDAKDHCDFLVAALQSDPTIDRPSKKQTDYVFTRETYSSGINQVCKNSSLSNGGRVGRHTRTIRPDIRILGSDYKDKQYKIVGKKYCEEIYYHDRSGHRWSTTHFRDRIKKA